MNIFTSNQAFLKFFVKAFAIVFSIIFFLYSIALRRQTAVMLRTVQLKNGSILKTIGTMHIAISFALLVSSIIFL